ncbi:MAG: GNAT family N-acetyltransferase [Hormoscilla sp. GUM202]|nr:GNAT family N-acetyltransferase [Hormoscilla sp. GUM202]
MTTDNCRTDVTQLRWQQFWAIARDGKIIACGQLRNFPGAQELGSLVVAPKWRDRGLGTILAKHLIEQATQPLYLECLGKGLPMFYSHLGFVPISWQELPRPLKFKFALSQFAKTLLKIPVEFMQYQGK